MKVQLKIIIYLVCLACINSCYQVQIKREIDIYSPEHLTKKQIIYQISDREIKIDEYRTQIQILKNYNAKFRYKIKFDNSYHSDTSDLKSTMEKNEEIIYKYRILIRKLELEIRVLRRHLAG